MKPRTQAYLLFWGTCLRRSRTAGYRRAVKSALAIAILITSGIASAPSAQAQTFKVLHAFAGTPDGAGPYAGLVFDSAGNLYGTTYLGGSNTRFGCVTDPAGCGTVFELDPTGKETVLFSFRSTPAGAHPTAGLVFGPGGYYGTTFSGGVDGAGMVFGAAVSHSFTGTPDGAAPYAGLIFDSAGNLYGTTIGGGDSGDGTVFKLDPTANETVLYSFTGTPDGNRPYGGLVLDSAGNLYGTTALGGDVDDGTVFKLDPTGKESVLYSFTGTPDGATPDAGLVFDSAGNLYGTTAGGGASGDGTVFKLDPTGKETVLYSFSGGDGATPYAGLVLDPAGNLYGTTFHGGASGFGTVFKVDPTGKETVLHSFSGGDGENPYASLVFDSAGNLYGTTFAGGIYEGIRSFGVVFELTAVTVPNFSLSVSPSGVTITQDGGPETNTVTISPFNGFAGSVTLSASGLPSGVTASFSPNPATSTTTLSLMASSTADLGTVPVTITGTSGNLVNSTTVNLTVAASNFNVMSAASVPATISPGSSATSTITVTGANGFAGSVTLSCSVAPSKSGDTDIPTCSVTGTNPVMLSSTATSVTSTVTVNTTGPSSSSVRITPNRPGSGSWPLLAVIMLPAFLFYRAPARRRWSMLACAVLFTAIAGFTACSSSNSPGGGRGPTGTSADTYTITVSGASGDATQTSTFSVTVN